jgi:hypothetical protein
MCLCPEEGYLIDREKSLARMDDVSVSMRERKQRFAQWHNKRVVRKGPLFEDRFKSVLGEADGKVLVAMPAYIALNPVRAGLVRDPKDYRWSGHGEAVAGKRERRAGIMRLFGDESEDVQRRGPNLYSVPIVACVSAPPLNSDQFFRASACCRAFGCSLI